MGAKADHFKKRNAQLKGEATTWFSFFQEISDYVMPRKGEITEKMTYPDTFKQDRLYDSTAIRANQTLAAGTMSMMSPIESPWMNYAPPRELSQDDDAKQWLLECTKTTEEILASSNFYTEIHEMYLDRGAFGLASLYVEPKGTDSLHFNNHEVGTYVIAENKFNEVDTYYREFKMSLRQMEQKFGIDNISKEKQKFFKEGKLLDEKFTILHAVEPRTERDSKRIDSKNMAFVSVYIDLEDKGNGILSESGYDEMPYMTTRYLKWSESAYGYCPSWSALPDARQVNFLEQHMDALAEIQAFPRLLVPASMQGEVDLRAAGVTYYNSSDPNAIPREWGTDGRYDIGLDRADRKRKAIEDAFHVDFFQMFKDLTQRMTAREVAERSNEKLVQFSPTFARLTTEFFNPLLKRVFGILIRQGAYPTPPDSVLEFGEGTVPLPSIKYTSRLALAIQERENVSLFRTLEMIQPLMQFDPAVADNFDFDVIMRDASRNNGFPPEWMRDQKKMEEIRKQRAEAQAKQAEQEQALQQAQAIQAVGNVPPENLENLQEQLPQQ